MGVKSKGRGTAAAFGLLLVFAGLIGAAVLYVLADRRPSQAVDAFARAPVGCTTTLDFTETGTFYVYEESGGEVEIPEGTCTPVADPNAVFGFELSGSGGAVTARRDDSIGYSSGERSGSSIARFEIEAAGTYEIAVVGDDLGIVAAIGRDPDDGVAEMRRSAILVGALGLVLGLLLLVVAGRRSKRAATYAAPEGPGWGPQQRDPAVPWPPEPPRARMPINPHQPSEPVSVAPPPPPLPARTPPTPGAPWAPPAVDAPTMEGPPPRAASRPIVAMPIPTLPDTPGTPSGVSPTAPPPEPDDD